MTASAAPALLGPGTRLTNALRVGLALIAVIVFVVQAIPVVTDFPVAIDLMIPLEAARRWLTGGGVYAADAFTDPEALPPFLYPPFILPLLAPLTALPDLAVRVIWMVVAAAAATYACRRLAIPWVLVPGVLLWAPMSGAIWGGNLQVLLFAAFVSVFWRHPQRFDLRAWPRDINRPGTIDGRLSFLAAAVGAVKITQAHAWLALARRDPRAGLLGLVPWALLVLLTLPLVGISLYGAWLEQLSRASDPAWPAMGESLLAYLPSPVFAALAVASITGAWLLRGRDTGAWLGIAMFLVAPNVHNFSGILLLPAMLRIRRELALMAAILTSTYTAQGWWLGVAIVVATMLAGIGLPALREPVVERGWENRDSVEQ